MIGRRLVADFPYIEAEVKYAIHKEYARTAVDVIGRRTRLAFQNVQAAHEALPRVVEIMQKELKWSKKEKEVRSIIGRQCHANRENFFLLLFPYHCIMCLCFCPALCPSSKFLLSPYILYQAQIAAAEQYLESMGYLARKEVREVPISLSYTDAQNYLKKFKAFDRDGDGHIRCIHAHMGICLPCHSLIW